MNRAPAGLRGIQGSPKCLAMGACETFSRLVRDEARPGGALALPPGAPVTLPL